MECPPNKPRLWCKQESKSGPNQAQGLNEKQQFRAESQPGAQQDEGFDFILESKMSW